ncbi:DUF3987 domain-containing protein [Mycobacteroides chelonae]|uniref:DUF3987 domain-containing protein n=1 Tax=Mycobacteroides chelonae TaxID=1774 RepID=UPI0008AA27D7|nr:DUF3987 domain-containing protein [Mycobacteroides chelonae]OHU53442.1 hypothetical protein BKG81_06480 [Mycobacteroides chelonae]
MTTVSAPTNANNSDTGDTPDAASAVEQLAGWGMHLIRLPRGAKEPPAAAWNSPGTPSMTAEQAATYVNAGGNVGFIPGRGSCRWLVIDAEDTAATDTVRSWGFQPTVVTAKSQAGPTLASGEANNKQGGTHTYVPLPAHAPQNLEDLHTAMLPNGGKVEIFVSCDRYIVAPPSRLDDAYGSAYVLTGVDAAANSAVPLAWLWDLTVPYPAGSEVIRGRLAPKSPREKVDQSARSVELDNQIDEVPWNQWIAGDPRLIATRQIDACGCPIYYWQGAGHSKSVTLHEGCEQGNGAHIWSGTMLAGLGLDHDHLSRLNLAKALHGGTIRERAAAVGIELGPEREGLQPLRPSDLTNHAAQYEAAGDTEHATLFRGAAAVMQSQLPTTEERGVAYVMPGTVVGASTSVSRAVLDSDSELASVVTLRAETQTTQQFVLGAVPPRPHTGAGPFPINALPKVLRDFAIAVADSMAVPVELVAPMQIAVLAAGCGPCNIYITDGWEAEPGAVWIMIVSPPSTRKTPVLKVIKAPMEEAVRIINANLGEQRAELQMEADALAEAADEAECDAKIAMKQAAKELVEDPTVMMQMRAAAAKATADGAWVPPTAQGLASDLAAKAAKLRRLADDAQAAVPPEVEPTFTDATPEAMMELLSRQKGRGFLIHPEASEILTAATRADTRGMETAKFNSAYDEEYISTHRIARGVTEVGRPSMCSLLIVQPEPVKEAYAPRQNGVKSKITSNGWSDRQGFVLVPESEPDSLRRDRSIDPGARAAYAEALTREWVRTYMLSATDREAWANLRFRLTPTAFEVIADHYDLVERIKRQPGTRAESWGKVIGRAVRIARCFAQLDVTVLDGQQEYPIEAHHMQSGWEIAQWMMRSFDAATGAPETVTVAELVEAAATYVLEKVPTVGDSILRPKVRSSKRHGPYIEVALQWLTARGQVEVRGQEVHRVALAAAA